MGDPHPLYFKGAYYMFYQHSTAEAPYSLAIFADGPWGWAHAMSKDLVHWKHLPPAITPKDHGMPAEDLPFTCREVRPGMISPRGVLLKDRPLLLNPSRKAAPLRQAAASAWLPITVRPDRQPP